MGTSLLQLVMAMGTGALLVNGITMSVPDMIAGAKDAANLANVRQLSTALELYNLDHNVYPAARNGTQLVNTLYNEGYIQSRPLDPTAFEYSVQAGGNAYTLKKK